MLKRFSLLLTALFLAMTASAGIFDGDTDITPSEGDHKVWHASTPVDVISGLEPMTVVSINGYQTLNLSEAIKKQSLFDGVEGRLYVAEDAEIEDDVTPLVISRETYLGRELVIKNVDGLILRGDAGAHLVIEDAFANVLVFENCNKLRIENLTLGHAVKKGTCTGGVIYLSHCNDVEIDGCDLYGCGTFGIEAIDCANLKVTNTVIRDCTYGGVELLSVGDVDFTDCDIVRCGNGASTVIATDCAHVIFNRCRFAQNTGMPMFWVEDAISLNDCEIHHNGELCNESYLLEGESLYLVDEDELSPRAIGPK